MPLSSIHRPSSPFHLHRTAVLLVVIVGVLISATAIAAIWSTQPVAPNAATRRPVDVPAIEQPLLVRKVAPREAVAINLAMPFSGEPNPAARSFKLRGSELARSRALECLTAAIYYEAATESIEGQRAVAQVVLNRVRHPAFPHSVCAVVYQGSLREIGCQFSFTCDASLSRRPVVALWSRARAIAKEFLEGRVSPPVGYATHYHANYVVPYWAPSLAKTAMIGTHIFYRWPGWWGRSAAFQRRHSGDELDPRLLREAALRRDSRRIGTESINSAAEFKLGTDPSVELISVIQFLAAKAPVTEQSSSYEREVHHRFSNLSEHLAVQIYRQIVAENPKSTPETAVTMLMQFSPPPNLQPQAALPSEVVSTFGGRPKLTGFVSALRDFATQSAFMTFYDERKPYYEKLAASARPASLELSAEFERKSENRFQGLHLIIAPLLGQSRAQGCRIGPKGSEAWMLTGTIDLTPLEAMSVRRLKSLVGVAARTECPLSMGAES